MMDGVWRCVLGKQMLKTSSSNIVSLYRLHGAYRVSGLLWFQSQG
jgi:hypothetical protein